MDGRKIVVGMKRNGFTLIELIIAALITAILAAAAFQFYVTMQQQVTTQKDISDMQQISRSCLQEIGKNLRMAGYMLPVTDPPHPAYDIVTSTEIWIYIGIGDPSAVDPVDTIKYFLEEYTSAEYANVPFLPTGMQLFKLMKQEEDWADPEVFADFITTISFTPIGTSEMAITLEVTTAKGDETFNMNDGFRTFVNTERITMRNLTI